MGSNALEHALQHTTTTAGRALRALTEERPALFVFLRHFGCTFCREAVSDLARTRAAIEEHAALVVVHLASPSEGTTVLARAGLETVPHVSDPKGRLYEAFGLERGSLRQLFGPAVVKRGVEAGIFGGHGIGLLAGDGLRMPGVFLVHRGEVLRSFVHRNAGERPTYADLAVCPLPAR
jgi:peroxiredoxin